MGWMYNDSIGKAEGYSVEHLQNGWLESIRFFNEFGGFTLTSFYPAFVNGTIVSNNVYTKYQYRGQGYGKKQHKDRLKIAKKEGFDTMLACVRKDNEVENHILELFGWEILTNLDDYHRLWKKDLTKLQLKETE